VNRRSGGICGGPASGSILVELLVAIMLLGLAIGPLAAGVQTARQRAAEVRRGGENLSVATGAADESGAWTWGPRIATAQWLPGQTLALSVDPEVARKGSVGLWVNGWFLREFIPETDGGLVIKGRVLRLDYGAELTVRVRVTNTAWGPPWRSLVPDATATSGGAMSSVRPEPAADGDAACTIIHAASLANPSYEVSAPEATIGLEGQGLPAFLSVPDAGSFRVRLGENEQSWNAEERRALDLYF
jgi:type II secretory pathway pseudopilin PulG